MIKHLNTHVNVLSNERQAFYAAKEIQEKD